MLLLLCCPSVSGRPSLVGILNTTQSARNERARFNYIPTLLTLHAPGAQKRALA